jgi:hypothetical protein
MAGMKQVLRLSWQITTNNNADHIDNGLNDNDSRYITATDDKTRLQALSLINDCYKYIITNLTTKMMLLITDALKFVQNSREIEMSREGGRKRQ